MSPEAGGAPLRLGPRPLPLHLFAAMAIWLSSQSALPLARNGSLPWRSELDSEARRLARALAAAPADRLARALAAEAAARFGEMLRGIAVYRSHSYRRRSPERPLLWREGASRLYDYGLEGASGAPVLFVPSLVNRGYILDLSERRSLLRFLANEGFRPLLLEWGAPGEAERGFAFDDYIAGRLARALDAAAAACGGPLVLAGYCMGGLMALAAALPRRDLAGLVLLATPFDFHAERAEEARRLGLLAAGLEPFFAPLGVVPVDFLQFLFAALDPVRVPAKFRAFAQIEPASPEALDFVALEDWVNDGIPLALPVAREVFMGWYGENRPARGLWRVGGRTVAPEALELPALVLVPANDRIVPPKGALALARAIPGARSLEVPFGHIGMVASAKAPERVWPEIVRWLKEAAKPGRAAAKARRTRKGEGGKRLAPQGAKGGRRAEARSRG